jgi:hypothetical protein
MDNKDILETDDGKWDGVIRAFWRRIQGYKKCEYNDIKELPDPLPVEFRAHFSTALLASPIAELINDRDEWKQQHENLLSVRESDLQVITSLRQQLTKPADEVLIEAAKAVVERWETPLWKDAPATAGYIYRLRDALNAKPADHIVDVNKMVSVADDTISVSKGEWEAVSKDSERFNWLMDNYKPMMRFSHLSDEWIIEIPFKHKLEDGITRTQAFIAEVDKAIQGASNG